MKGTIDLSDDYFLKYKDKPVRIIPFDPKTKNTGLVLVKEIEELLNGSECIVILRGSTLYEISGKGDIEIGIYTLKENWKKVFQILELKFGDAEVIEAEYARFNFEENKREFEIMMFAGRSAYVDMKLTHYLWKHRELLKEYEEIKKKYSYSKRDYNREKNRFLRRVEREIPEE